MFPNLTICMTTFDSPNNYVQKVHMYMYMYMYRKYTNELCVHAYCTCSLCTETIYMYI